jgi:nucleotide-binding universal stress UspA family protein
LNLLAADALEHAIAIAEDAGSSIDVLHVETPEEFSVGSGSPLSPDASAELDRALDEAFARASARISPATESSHMKVKTNVKAGAQRKE